MRTLKVLSLVVLVSVISMLYVYAMGSVSDLEVGMELGSRHERALMLACSHDTDGITSEELEECIEAYYGSDEEMDAIREWDPNLIPLLPQK